MEKPAQHFGAVTVTLNPAIDRTVTIPNFTAGAVNRVEADSSHPGGKGVNVAAALADYGHRVAATGFLGSENAAPFEEMFARKQIDDRFVRIAGQTRIGIKVADPALRQTTDINFAGPAPAPADLETLVRLLGGMEADCFVLAGSLPPGMDAAIYARLIGMLRTGGGDRRVVLDASGEPLRLAIDAKPDWIKPNIHELESLMGESLPDTRAVIEAARKLNRRGIGMVVVSMGREGACFVTGEKAVVARPPDVEVKSTVGAGDAMVAGIIAGQLAGLPLRECARLATAFSLDVLVSGKSGITSRAGIEGLMSRVTIAD